MVMKGNPHLLPMCVLKVLPMCVPATHPGPLPRGEGEALWRIREVEQRVTKRTKAREGKPISNSSGFRAHH